MRLFNSILMVGALLFATTAANALTFNTVVTGATGGLTAGDQFQVDITVTLDPGDELNALGASIYGYDQSVIQFVSGTGIAEIFMQAAGTSTIPVTDPFCIASPTSPFCQVGPPTAGLLTNIGPALADVGVGTGKVEIIAGIDLFDTYVAQLFQDPGQDGNPGTVQFSAIFEAVGAGITNAIIGTGVDLDGVAAGPGGPIGSNNGGVTVTVVPEPGTALLMGLGLAGLGLAGRRQE